MRRNTASFETSLERRLRLNSNHPSEKVRKVANGNGIEYFSEDGALSEEAIKVGDDEKIYVFQWPTLVYVGYDSAKHMSKYVNRFLVLNYKPELKLGFGKSAVLAAPEKGEVTVVN